MTVLETLNFVAFNPLANNNPIAVRRRKLATDDTKRHRTNGLYSYPSTATVTKSTR